MLAESYGATTPRAPASDRTFTRGSLAEQDSDVPGKRRVLVLGWNHKVPALLHEFDTYVDETFEVDILSSVPEANRTEDLERYDLLLHRVETRQLKGDYTAPSVLERSHPHEYDNIIILASEYADSLEDADSRTILACLLLREFRSRTPSGFPHVLVELMDPENALLLPPRLSETLVSPSILSHILAQVALRHELRAVFDELFGSGGAEISFRPASHYNLVGQELTFSELHEQSLIRGETAIGVCLAAGELREDGGITLNPPADSRWNLQEQDEIVVVTSYAKRQT